MSSSSADAVPGFTLERSLGRRTWEATQLDLGRRVALRRLDPGTPFHAADWPEHVAVVPLYAVVETDAGLYVATRLVPGARTLAEAGGASAGRRRRRLAAARAVLDEHPHGDLTASDILIDPAGRVLLTGFGRAGAGAGDDRAALARLSQPERRRGWAAPAAAAAAAVLAVAVAVALAGDGDDDGAPAVPPITRGATAIGSALAGGAVDTVDCDGVPPDGTSPLCTVLQAKLPDRRLTAERPGIVRGWAVRGARGRIALVVLQPMGRGYISYNRSRIVEVSDPDTPAYFRADRSAPAGARFGIELSPGAAIGIRRRVAGASTSRVFGPLRSAPIRVPVNRGGAGEELLLRVDLVNGPG